MQRERWKVAALLTLLTGYCLLVHGYHPYAEDGGVYVAGVKWLLNPALYPVGRAFVVEHTRFSSFAFVLADMVRWSGLGLSWVLLLGYLASVWATMLGGWMVLAHCTQSFAARCGGVTLLACWLTMPVAGTSLMMMDPYLTARSVTTATTLLALAGMLEVLAGGRRGWVLCVAALLVGFAVHPLMAGYGLVAVVLLVCLGAGTLRVRMWGLVAVVAFAVLLALGVQWASPVESAEYLKVVATRYYWFPAEWTRYERFGLVGPLIVLSVLCMGSRERAWRLAGATAMGLAGLGLAVAALFCRAGLPTHVVARMQPLRCFQTVYPLMVLLLGAWVGERVLQGKIWRWGALMVGMGLAMFGVERQTYPASDHMEMSWMQPANSWVRAFVWVREHTEPDAVFALDARYIGAAGEDAQGFRAIAERSALPDFSKDGGVAAIAPRLTAEWARGVATQTGLDAEGDSERVAALQRAGVTWVVLRRETATSFACPYGNEVVKVCRVGLRAQPE